MELLAILGRGIHQETKGGPWRLTEDLEVCDERGAHLPVRVRADDANPNCLIGGGEMNFMAGWWLINEHEPHVVVFAYGSRSDYLVSADGPSEGEVMSEQYLNPPNLLWKSTSLSDIVVWPRGKIVPGRSNTDRELQNIFELALERNFTKIGVVTVHVHCARVLLMAQRHLVKPEFAHLKLQFYVSESVLMNVEPNVYGPRIRAMHFSKAFMRSMHCEVRGINHLLAGTY
jgi:hypothetical protein